MIELYEHNKKAYENVLEKFKISNKTCVIHPTGTGKSFISLKWLYENKDKKCLFLTSNNIIVDQLLRYIEESGLSRKDFPNLEINTYHNLKDNNTKYDCIVLDEFHRCGAPEWGKEVSQVLENNKEAKILGVSATPIRYLDNGRDMSEELFDGNIASKMSLAQAVARRILPVPKYINCIYSFKEEIEEIENLINKERDEKRKIELQKRLDKAKEELEKIEGIGDIFEKYLPNKTGKYVVFCKDKQHLEQMKEEVNTWLSNINENINIYSITSDYEREINQYTISRFENNKNKGIDLLFSIEMLNEGLHAKGIDGVIMLRPTYSPIIYLQQLGRALSTNNENPIIFDIVNNSESFDSIYSFRLELEETIKDLMAEYKNNFTKVKELNEVLEQFKIIDEYKDFSKQLQNIHMDATFTWDDWYKLAKNYYNYHGDLNVNSNFITLDGINYDKNGYKLGVWIGNQRAKKNKLSEERIKQLEDIGMMWNALEETWNHNFELLKKYKEHYGHANIPGNFKTKNGIDYLESGIALGSWLSTQKYNKTLGKLSLERCKLLDEIGVTWNLLSDSWDKHYVLVKANFEHHGKLIIPNNFKTKDGINFDIDGINITSWVKKQRSDKKNNKLDKEKQEKLEAVGFVWEVINEAWNTNYNLAKKFYEHYGNLKIPEGFKTKDGINYDEEGIALYGWLSKQRSKKDKLTEEQIEKLEAIGINWFRSAISWEEKFALVKNYFEKNGNLKIPRDFKTKDGINYDEDGYVLFAWLSYQKANKDKLTKTQIKKLNSIGMVWDNAFDIREQEFEIAVAYFKHYGNLNVPEGFKTKDGINYDEDGFDLDLWIKNKRKKKNKLSKEQIDKLTEMGMVWSLLENAWDQNFEKARNYYNYYGNLKIPEGFKTKDGINYDTSKGSINLEYWINRQRKKKSELTSSQIDKLDSIGMIWDVKDLAWNEKFELAKKFYEYHSNLEVDYDFKTKDGINYDEDGYILGKWVYSQRIRKDKLSQIKIEKLDSIGMVWNVLDNIWEQNYELAKKYYEYHGNLDMKAKFKTKDGINYDEDGCNLGIWIVTQRTKKDKLTEEQIDKLESIGITWNVHEDSWYQNYELAKVFYNHYGHLRIVDSFKTKDGINYDEDGIALGNWLTNQRIKKKKDLLTEEQIKKLESIEISWGVREDNWKNNYELAKKYYEYHGNLLVPQDFKTSDGIIENTEGIELGSWISNLRLKKHKLTSEQIVELEAIGMVWNVLEESWERNYKLAKNYFEHYGNLTIPQKFKTTDGINYDKEGYAIGNWTLAQKANYEKMSFEKRQKLEDIGIVWNSKEDKLIRSTITKDNQQQVTEYLYKKLNSLLDGHYEFKTKEDIDILNQDFDDSIYIAKRK